jgi:uncharacterized membrane protein YeaQ/YmgE (transglycosylase-associated protein family)
MQPSMKVSDILSAILVGAVIGTLGRLVLPGRQRVGIFATLLVGIGAALLGLVVAGAFGLRDKAPASVWFLHWHWWVLAIQVGLAVVGIAIANMMTYTRLADGGVPTRRRRTTRRRRASRSSA